MAAQKNALDAATSTIEALKTQADLRVEPLKDQIAIKEATIQVLQERKALAEEKLKESEDRTNQIISTLPVEVARNVQAAVEAERLKALTSTVLSLKLGYYLGVMNLASAAIQIQSLTFARLGKENLSEERFAMRASAEYFKNVVLFLNRENGEAGAQILGLIGGGVDPAFAGPAKLLTERLRQIADANQCARESGLAMNEDVASLSSVRNLPWDAPTNAA